MRDVFYTLMVVWIIWRIMNGVNSVRSAAGAKATPRPDVRNDNVGPTSGPRKMHIPDSEGEYVDFEEIN